MDLLHTIVKIFLVLFILRRKLYWKIFLSILLLNQQLFFLNCFTSYNFKNLIYLIQKHLCVLFIKRIILFFVNSIMQNLIILVKFWFKLSFGK